MIMDQPAQTKQDTELSHLFSLLSNASNPSTSTFTQQDLITLRQCVLVSSSEHDKLDLCRLLSTHISKAQFQDHTLKSTALTESINPFLTCLPHSLPLLAQFLYSIGNGALVLSKHNEILVSVTPHARTNRYAIQCLGNICIKLGMKHVSTETRVLDTLLSILSDLHSPTSSKKHTTAATAKLTTACLKSIQLLIAENKALFASPQLISTLCTRLETILFSPSSSTPRSTDSPTRLRGRSESTSSWRTTTTTPSTTSKSTTRVSPSTSTTTTHSDSEDPQTDTDPSPSTLASTPHDSTIQTSLYTLTSLAKSHPRLIYPSWPLFLPRLFTLLNPSSPTKTRIAAAQALHALVEGSQAYLAVADDSAPVGAYTSLSQRVARVVVQLHDGVFGAVRGEKEGVVLRGGLVGACCAVVRVLPYARIVGRELRGDGWGVVWGIVEGVAVGGGDLGLLEVYLPVLTCLLDAGHVVDDVSPLVTLLTKLISASTEPLTLAILDLFSAITRTHTSQLPFETYTSPQIITPLLHTKTQLITVACMKLIEQTALAHKQSTSPDLWTFIIETYIRPGLTNPHYAIRALSVETLSHLPPPLPPLLPPETQTLIKSVPKYITDTNENVRAVSCFVGGVYISEHDYLRRDRAFMEALGEALVSVREDGDVTVRVRGVWAVANLGDALVAGVAEGEGVGLSKGVVKGLVGCAVFGAGDHEKCRGNGVRALGNFFRVAEKDCFSEGLVKEVDLIVRNLNAGPFKTRWNAGYAAFNLVISPLFLDLHDIMPTLPVLFDALSTAMTASKNFKVRINAAMALGACSDVTMYRGKTMDLIRVVQVAQESVDDLGGTDFGEYKYKTQLTSQLGRTLQHLRRLVGLIADDDSMKSSKTLN